jgi:hypothetical protein
MSGRVLAAASLGAGLIHVTAVSGHAGHPTVMTFFALLAVAQIGWAMAVVRRPDPALLRAGVVLSLVVVGIWLLSRATGLPGVAGVEEAEPVGLKDSVATALEIVLVAGRALRGVPSRLVSTAAVSCIAAVTALGLSAPGHGHRHDEGGAAPHFATDFRAGHGQDDSTHGHEASVDEHSRQNVAAQHVGAQHVEAHHDDPAMTHLHGRLRAASHRTHDPMPAEGTSGHHHADAPPPTGGDHHVHQEHKSHDKAVPHESHAAHENHAGHDRHDAGEHGDESCAAPVPNRTLTTLQEITEFFLGAGCAEPAIDYGGQHRCADFLFRAS